jgi:hypothetical protein
MAGRNEGHRRRPLFRLLARRRDHHAVTNARAERVHRTARHAVRRLASGDTDHARDGTSLECVYDEPFGIDRSQRGADDGQQIFAELGMRTGQCERFASDQADSLVTTSNFFNSELTSSSALSLVHS